MRIFFLLTFVIGFSLNNLSVVAGKHKPEYHTDNGGKRKLVRDFNSHSQDSVRPLDYAEIQHYSSPETFYNTCQDLMASENEHENAFRHAQEPTPSVQEPTPLQSSERPTPPVQRPRFNQSSASCEPLIVQEGSDNKNNVSFSQFETVSHTMSRMGRSLSYSDIQCKENGNIPLGHRSTNLFPPRPKSPNFGEMLRSVSLMVICPNDYEFLPIYMQLSQDERYIPCVALETTKSLLLQNLMLPKINIEHKHTTLEEEEEEEDLELDPIYFFSTTEGDVFCLAIGGERSNEIGYFLGQIRTYFKNLKQVFLAGICGCLNDTVALGSVVLPYKFSSLRIIYGQLKDHQKSEFYHELGNILWKFETTLEQTLTYTYKEIIHGISGHLCHSITTNNFLNDKGLGNALLNYLPNDLCIVDMEDYVVYSKLFDYVPVLVVRTVSDHAGMVGSTQDNEGREQSEFEREGKSIACGNLATVIPNAIYLFFIQQKNVASNR